MKKKKNQTKNHFFNVKRSTRNSSAPVGSLPFRWYPERASQVAQNLCLHALFIFLSLLPTQLGKHFFLPFSYISGVRIDYLTPTLYLTDILALLIILLNLKSVARFFSKKIFTLFFILLFINISFSLVKPLALYQSIKIIEILSLFAVFRESRIKNQGFIFIALSLGAFFELMLAVTQFTLKHSLQGIAYFFGERYMTLSTPDIAKASLQGIEILRPYGTFSHPNSLAGFYLFIYFYALSEIRHLRSEIRYALLFLSSALVFISFSKSAILVYLFLNIVYLIKTKFYEHCRLCFAARIVVLFVLAGIILITQGDALSIEKRLTLIGNAFSIVSQHPLFGVGLGNYLVAQSSFASKYPYVFIQPVHNIFLLLIAETGIVFGGFILYQVARFMWTNKNMAMFCCSIVVLTGMLDHYWLTLQQNVLLLPVVFGLLGRQKT